MNRTRVPDARPRLALYFFSLGRISTKFRPAIQCCARTTTTGFTSAPTVHGPVCRRTTAVGPTFHLPDVSAGLVMLRSSSRESSCPSSPASELDGETKQRPFHRRVEQEAVLVVVDAQIAVSEVERVMLMDIQPGVGNDLIREIRSAG